MNEPPARDFFDKARAWAVALMLAAGLACIVGSLLDWVTITARPELQEGATFPGADNQPEVPRVTRPFTGIEAGDGWWSLAGGVVLVVAAALVYVRRRAAWGWLGVLAAVVIGAVTIANYRGVGDLSSSISHRMNIVGGAEPAIGLTLAVAGAIAGVIGSVAAIAASPRPEALRTSA